MSMINFTFVQQMLIAIGVILNGSPATPRKLSSFIDMMLTIIYYYGLIKAMITVVLCLMKLERNGH